MADLQSRRRLVQKGCPHSVKDQSKISSDGNKRGGISSLLSSLKSIEKLGCNKIWARFLTFSVPIILLLF